jgi:predicted nucleic acid-binding protein
MTADVHRASERQAGVCLNRRPLCGVRAELLFLEELERGAYELATFDPEDVGRAREIVAKYHDLQIGLADASIVVLRSMKLVSPLKSFPVQHPAHLRATPRFRSR